jgi:hypothetical protein
MLRIWQSEIKAPVGVGVTVRFNLVLSGLVDVLQLVMERARTELILRPRVESVVSVGWVA